MSQPQELEIALLARAVSSTEADVDVEGEASWRDLFLVLDEECARAPGFRHCRYVSSGKFYQRSMQGHKQSQERGWACLGVADYEGRPWPAQS